MKNKLSRRDFIKSTTTSVAALSATNLISSCNTTNKMPTRVLGKTGLVVSLLTFGGGSKFLKNDNGVWEKQLENALDAGVNIFDTASTYQWRDSANSEERFGQILSAYRNKVFISTKFNSRKPDDAMKEVESSLKKLKTDYVDILLMHSVEKSEDLDAFGDGVYKTMLDLKEQGIARNIGFSSMNSAKKSRELLDRFEIDVCILAMNPTKYGDFAEIALPVARQKNVGVIAMKLMKNIVGKDATAKELIHYALSNDGVSSAVIAHEGLVTLNENIQIVSECCDEKLSNLDHIEIEQRLAHLAGPHALSWAKPGYYDGLMC